MRFTLTMKDWASLYEHAHRSFDCIKASGRLASLHAQFDTALEANDHPTLLAFLKDFGLGGLLTATPAQVQGLSLFKPVIIHHIFDRLQGAGPPGPDSAFFGFRDLGPIKVEDAIVD